MHEPPSATSSPSAAAIACCALPPCPPPGGAPRTLPLLLPFPSRRGPRTAPRRCRRTRGDGNCFFRSFFFGYLEHLLLSGDAGERDRAARELEGLKQALVDVGGYDEIGEARPRCARWVACSLHRGSTPGGWLCHEAARVVAPPGSLEAGCVRARLWVAAPATAHDAD